MRYSKTLNAPMDETLSTIARKYGFNYTGARRDVNTQTLIYSVVKGIQVFRAVSPFFLCELMRQLKDVPEEFFLPTMPEANVEELQA